MPTSNEILEVSVGFDGRQLVAGGEKVMGSLKKNTNIATTAVDDLNYAIEDTSDVLKDNEDAVAGVAKGEKKRLEFVLTHTKKLADLEHRLLTANKTEKKDIEELQKIQEKNYKILTAKTSGYMKKLIAVREATEDLNKEQEDHKTNKVKESAGYGGHKMGEDIGESFKEAVRGIGGKDVKGMADGLFGFVGKLGKGAKGFGMRAEAKVAGGGQLAGLEKLAPILKTIGPMLMVASATMVGLVKLFIDAQAAAMDFNKEVLATTDSTGFMARNLGNANAASQDLKETMKEMYSQATDLDNLNWGISKETHSQIISALGAQGVQMAKTEEYFDAIKSGRHQTQGMVKDWGSMSKMSVAYSRTFAVSMGEITDLQGEMMGELGMSFDNVQSGFQSMAEGAADAGVASNKFFGQMRAISADMSLFNNRTEASAKLMAKLDQAMSPKKATEFFGTIQKFFKGMSTMDRAKVTLSAGAGKTKAIEQKSLASSIDGLSADFNQILPGMGKEFKQALGSKSALTKFMAKNGKKLSGEQKDAIMKASRLQTKVARGDTLSLASGLADIDPMSTIDELDAVAKTRFGKPMEDLNALEREGMKLYANVDDDMMDNLGNLKMAFDSSKEAIVQKLSSGEKLTADEAKMMQKLGISYKDGAADAEAAKALGHKDSKAVYNAMTKDQRDLLEDSKKTIDYAKEQKELTQTFTDKLGVLLEFIMRQVYEVIVGIWDALPFGDKQAKELAKLQVKAVKSGNKELAASLSKAGNMGEARGAVLDSKPFKKQGDAILGFAEAQENLAKGLVALETKSLGGPLSKEDDAKKKALEEEMKGNEETRAKLVKFLSSQKMDEGDMAGAVQQAMTRAGMVKEDQGWDPKVLKLNEELRNSNGDLAKSMDNAGFSTDEQSKILEKLRLSITSTSAIIGSLDDPTGGGAAATTTPATPAPSAQSGEAPRPSAQGAAAAPSSAAAAAPAAPPVVAPAGPPALPSNQPLNADDLQEATEKQGENIQSTMDDLATSLHRSSGGIVFNGPYLKGKFGNQMEASVYSAASRALFEYWMYQDVKKEDALKAVKSGVNPRDFGSSFLGIRKSEGINDDKSAVDKMTQMSASKSGPRAPGNAEGGVVGRPAPGEFLASVKPGEKIIPVGGGGGGATKVILELKGDMLKQIIRATTLNTLNEHDRAKTSR